MSKTISTYEGMEHVDAPCHNCGDPVRTLIMLGAPVPRRICERCLNVNRAPYDVKDQQREELLYLARSAFRLWGQHGPVKVFRPGDSGFARRAKQVQLPIVRKA